MLSRQQSLIWVPPYELDVVEAVEEDEYIQVGVCHRLEHVWMAFVEEMLGICYAAGHDGLPHFLPCRQLLSLLLWPEV